MEIAITPELEQLIQQRLQSGQYASASEVLLAGVKLLGTVEQVYGNRFDELQCDVLLGVEAADRGDLVDGDVVFDRLRQKLDHHRNSQDCQWLPKSNSVI